MMMLLHGEKYGNVFNRFDTNDECDGRTDRQNCRAVDVT